MSCLFMLTIKAKPGLVAHQMSTVIKWFKKQDSHYWIVALEHGASGYTHFQIRGDSRYTFTELKAIFPNAHIEETKNRCDYERKEGWFISNNDTINTLRIRFGKPTELQQSWLSWLHNQSDRQIDVWYDKQGNHGKTWLSIHLWEKGLAYIVPRYACTPQTISSFICASYIKRGYRPIIIIDIPRASKIPPGLYEAIEEIKDGLVQDPRYTANEINIRGVSIMVFTNTMLDTKKLSADRWRLHGMREDALL